MIEKLRGMAIFTTVVDCGTFRAAAAQLDLSPSRVSEAVSDLEKNIGVTLLYRSTRHLSLTQDGSILYDQAKIMMTAADRGLDAITPSLDEPKGVLRITAPAFVTQTSMMDVIAEFLIAYPKIRLNLDFTDERRNLIKDGFDLGIRVGWLEDSELLTRNIGHAERWLVVRSTYASARPAPTHPSDLDDWDWIHFSMRGAKTKMTSQKGDTVSVTGRSNITVNSADAVFQLAKRGLGITPLPKEIAKGLVDEGYFVHLLPDWSLEPIGLQAVWPGKATREKMTLLFVSFLTKAIGKCESHPLKILP